MKRVRIEKPRPRGDPRLEVLPLDPRDPEIVRAKSKIYSGHAPNDGRVA